MPSNSMLSDTFRLLFLAALPLLLSTNPLSAQDPADDPQESRLNVFFDCNGRNCNSSYYRTEISWVNWVRNREDADVHVIMTSQATGAGGREYVIDLEGRDAAEGYVDQFTHVTLPTDTDREELDGIAYTLGLAFARFAQLNGFGEIVRLEGVAAEEVDPGERVLSADEANDPWNLWVFRINGNANLDGEDTRKNTRINTGFSANRVTPVWKLNFSGNANFNRREFETSDTTTFKDTRTDWNYNSLVAYGLADHWSVGLDMMAGRLTRFNQDFRAEVRPAIEYSYFPYEEATRRALTVTYDIGPTYRDYIEETLFGELEETRFEQALEIELSQRQTWGDASVSIEISHFLHDIEQRNISLDGDIDFRITRGLSVNAEGNVSWVNDQIFLSAEGASPEEILLRLAQQGTDFTWGFQVGFSFQFGSIFNNVVNNRFRRGRGGFGGFGF